MSDSAKFPVDAETPKVRKLRDAVRKVRIAEAERVDAFADLYEAEKARLGMLAEELAGVFREVPDTDDYFLFAVAPGNPPRLWIDPTTHVVIARDRRTYRFLKDSRLGRAVIRESADIDDVADAVTDYVAERIVERERALEMDWAARPREVAVVPQKRLGAGAVAAFLLGAVLGVAGIVAYAWITVAPL